MNPVIGLILVDATRDGVLAAAERAALLSRVGSHDLLIAAEPPHSVNRAPEGHDAIDLRLAEEKRERKAQRRAWLVRKNGPIDTGDVVKHAPTGEEWVVAYIDGPRLSWLGWPPGLALVSDCTLVEKATLEQRIRVLRQLAESQHHGSARARETLEREGLTVDA